MWRFGQECKELVLLGDVFDFWRGRPAEAIRDSRYFFQKLSELNLKISYVIGNHDHHLAVMHQECQIIEKLAGGGEWGVISHLPPEHTPVSVCAWIEPRDDIISLL
ncbi:MAG: hypothetical protein MUO26_06260 [Methanotrichaceae archaeon]|nr:hypothetical protein [Methanotrichaceae archaeon]